MWVRDIPIPVERIDTPVLRLLDGVRVETALYGQELYEGFVVAIHLYEALQEIGSRVPFLAVALEPRELTLASDGTHVDLQVEAIGGLEEARHVGLDVRRGLTADEAAKRIADALSWPAGEKVLVPSASGLAGLCRFEAYLCDRSQPAASASAAPPRLFASRAPNEPFPIRFAFVRPEGRATARRWAQVLHGGSLLPVAEELGLDAERCVEGEGGGAVPWLSVGIFVAGLADDGTAVLRLHVTEAPSVGVDTVRKLVDPERGAEGWADLQKEVRAAIDVTRVWPAPIRLCRLPREGGILTCAVRLQEHAHAPGAARRLAEAAMSALLRGMPLEGVRRRLQSLWDDPRSLRALETLATL